MGSMGVLRILRGHDNFDLDSGFDSESEVEDGDERRMKTPNCW
ncbi:predicted protein [Botrytis cinerea T4]|uniref:Uncharacterized protein n=1 Tax=Botryotinia fuckeliana (strain T4) TaxID=999810 RepID=G2YQN2_BOTF4|nr:predicted protein [Botrytis cinerea T4]